MKVVYLARFLPAEGSTLHLYTLAEELVRQGHTVTIVSAGPGPDPHAQRLLTKSGRMGVRHAHVKFPLQPSYSSWGKVRQLGAYLAALPSALWAIHKVKPDVVHIHYPVTSFVAAIYRRMTNTPTVVTHHALGIPRHPLNRRAQAAVAISDELAAELVERHGYPESAVTVIYNGVDSHALRAPTEDERREARADLGIAEAQVVIGYVGRLTEVKGVDLLLAACAPLLGPTALLLIAGGTTEEARKWLEPLPRETVRFVLHCPFVPDVRRVYAALDIFALASRTEGFPLSSIEAMMMGVPVLRTRTGGASTQVVHGRTGMLVPSENVEALRAALMHLIHLAPEERRIMGRRAAERASSMFSHQNMTEQTVQLYKELLERRS